MQIINEEGMRPYCRYDHEDIPEGIPEHDYPSTYVIDHKEYRCRGHLLLYGIITVEEFR